MQESFDGMAIQRPGGEDAGLLGEWGLIEITDAVFSTPGQGHDGFIVAENQGVPLSRGPMVDIEMIPIDDSVGGFFYTGVPACVVDVLPADIINILAGAHLPTMRFRKSILPRSMLKDNFFPKLFWSGTVFSWLEKSLL